MKRGSDDVAVDVGEGELHRLDAQVRDLGPVAVETGQLEILEDAQRHAGCDALARRRDLMQRRAAIGEADRIDPVGLVRGEVLLAQRAAGFAGVLVHRVGQFAAIEGLALALGDLSERPGLVRELPEFARLRRTAVRQERLDPALLALEPVDRPVPLVRDHVRDAEPVMGILDRRLEQVGEGQLAVALVQFHPERHRARSGHAAPADMGHLVEAGILVGRHQRRRMAVRVEAHQLLAVPQDAEGVGCRCRSSWARPR
jgi:hypothetical protein